VEERAPDAAIAAGGARKISANKTNMNKAKTEN
jgi:hypothetical protein